MTHGKSVVVPVDEMEDAISDAIGDSMDMDWTYRDGAKAVIATFKKHGWTLAAAPSLSTAETVVVPKHPTEEMLDAVPVDCRSSSRWRAKASAAYQAMLSAAPAREPEGGAVAKQQRAVDEQGPRTGWRELDWRSESEVREWESSPHTVEYRDLYTTPPSQPLAEGEDAEKLRVAVEALGAITDLSTALRQGGPDSMDLHDLSDNLNTAVDLAHEALAALQQEGR